MKKKSFDEFKIIIFSSSKFEKKIEMKLKPDIQTKILYMNKQKDENTHKHTPTHRQTE